MEFQISIAWPSQPKATETVSKLRSGKVIHRLRRLHSAALTTTKAKHDPRNHTKFVLFGVCSGIVFSTCLFSKSV
jgi:hypothetical protein